MTSADLPNRHVTKAVGKAGYHHGDLAVAAVSIASTIVAAEGAAALSLRAVATQAGVSHTALYRHFDTRDDLLDAVAASWIDELVDAGEPDDDLATYVRRYVVTALDAPALYACVFDAASRRGARRTHDAFRRFRIQSAEVFAREHGVSGDELRDGVLRLWGTLHGMVDLYWRGLIRARNRSGATDYIVGSVVG